jgi:hypothetical protein
VRKPKWVQAKIGGAAVYRGDTESSDYVGPLSAPHNRIAVFTNSSLAKMACDAIDMINNPPLKHDEETFEMAEASAKASEGSVYRKMVNGQFWLHIYWNEGRDIEFQYRLGSDFVSRDIALYVWRTIDV